MSEDERRRSPLVKWVPWKDKKAVHFVIYTQTLTEQGCIVGFSRISLRNKKFIECEQEIYTSVKLVSKHCQ